MEEREVMSVKVRPQGKRTLKRNAALCGLTQGEILERLIDQLDTERYRIRMDLGKQFDPDLDLDRIIIRAILDRRDGLINDEQFQRRLERLKKEKRASD